MPALLSPEVQVEEGCELQAKRAGFLGGGNARRLRLQAEAVNPYSASDHPTAPSHAHDALLPTRIRKH
eukprot:3897674-Pleurochrysis_carterae.AAC.1